MELTLTVNQLPPPATCKKAMAIPDEIAARLTTRIGDSVTTIRPHMAKTERQSSMQPKRQFRVGLANPATLEHAGYGMLSRAGSGFLPCRFG